MINSRVVLIDTYSDDSNQFETLLKGVGVKDLQVLGSQDLLSRNKMKGAGLILLNCFRLSEALMSGLLLLANQNPTTQILVLANQISIFAYRQVAAMRNIVILQTPVDSTIFEGLVQDLMSEEPKSMMRYPRFVTNEPARMMVMDSGLLIPTRMRNYSAGGAFFEYKGISLKVGHNLHLSILNQMIQGARDRLQMSARVVWIREGDNPLSTARGIGVQFVEDPKDVIRGAV